MSDKQLPSPELLRQLLRYDPETGKLFWLPRPAEMFPDKRAAKAWNTKWAEKPAFTAPHNRGYLHGGILKQRYLAHRVIWAMQTGEWPKDEIDHANNTPSDNRWSNLRAATRSENTQNTSSRKGSTSKYLGVCRKKKSSKWMAIISSGGARIVLGLFDCEIEAARAYDAAARLRYGKFCNPNFPEDC